MSIITMNNEEKIIKKLIEKGFKLESISFEFDIPLERVQQYKKELDKTTEKEKNDEIIRNALEVIQEKNNKASSKMKEMRGRYNRLFLGNSNNKTKKETPALSKEDTEIIETIITSIEEKLEEMQSLSKKEKREATNEILKKLKKIKPYPLTLKQGEKLNSLIEREEFNVFNFNRTDSIIDFLNSSKRDVVVKFLEAIELATEETDNLRNLEILSKKITPKMQQSFCSLTSTVRSKINTKILQLKRAEILNNIKYNVSPSIESIISNLATGELNIEEANEKIQEEAKRRVESKPKTKFTLTEEREKKQILMQIRTILKENPDKYYIKNPYDTIQLLNKLCGDEIDQSARTVIEHLMERKDFSKAKEVCNTFYSKHADFKNVRRLKKEINCAEIGDLLLRALKSKGTDEEEASCFRLIETGLEKGEISPSLISLGKSKDKTRNITLEDILPNKTYDKNKNRMY